MTRAEAPFRRDAVTRAGYATLAAYGWFLYSFGPTVPLLRAEQGISRTVASLHNVAFSVGAVNHRRHYHDRDS